jgi:hypothetical protein
MIAFHCGLEGFGIISASFCHDKVPQRRVLALHEGNLSPDHPNIAHERGRAQDVLPPISSNTPQQFDRCDSLILSGEGF